MLPIVGPLTNVLVAVGEDHRAVAVLFALHEVAVVALTVLVRQFALAFEEVMAEIALVRALRLSKVINTYGEASAMISSQTHSNHDNFV